MGRKYIFDAQRNDFTAWNGGFLLIAAGLTNCKPASPQRRGSQVGNMEF